MLETSEERIKLLKAGVTGKSIERLYIAHNNLKIINHPVLVNIDDDVPGENRKELLSHEMFSDDIIQ